jgi:hypothetical protein
MDTAVQRERRFGGKIDRPAVQDRQRPGKAETDRTDIGVRGMTEAGAAPAEYLRVGEQPGVDLEANNRFESHEV